ncbi:hypothetical protein HELRODRAFT_174134 [Helobdella robusta]|uniref:Uncharacterized protein n=1 Tax=Helobdella robusta TaxID=6412 RepID=T1F7N9_HELRO|nr:hypothetical protein HELRODRAFT_174134 [Helobdella robusta]ESO03232.1 hypothetical protein HELRODRAFT_174134 [Helobdella robusta]
MRKERMENLTTTGKIAERRDRGQQRITFVKSLCHLLNITTFQLLQSVQDRVLWSICNVVYSLDLTREPKKISLDVLDAVVSQIQASQIFSNDRLFLKKIAFERSVFGRTDKIFRASRTGLWQISEEILNGTKINFPKYFPILYSEVKLKFGIDWSNVLYEDLDKALHNGLAARIAIHLRYQKLPIDTVKQSEIWSTVFRNGRDELEFMNGALFFKTGKQDFEIRRLAG